MEVLFEIDGRPIKPQNIADEMEKIIYKKISENLVSQLKGIIDPITGDQPKILVKGKSLSELEITVSGSEELISAVQKKLNN